MSHLIVEPPQGVFCPADQGGQTIHNVVNNTPSRLAIKIKCSDNNLYRLRPVFAVLEPAQALAGGLSVARGPGPAKTDKLVIQYAEAPEGEMDASNVFRGQPGPFLETIIPLIASDNGGIVGEEM